METIFTTVQTFAVNAANFLATALIDVNSEDIKFDDIKDTISELVPVVLPVVVSVTAVRKGISFLISSVRGC